MVGKLGPSSRLRVQMVLPLAQYIYLDCSTFSASLVLAGEACALLDEQFGRGSECSVVVHG
jgi:hypothetical protein